MKETAFNKSFVDKMKLKYPHMHGWKIHGHEMQESGIPDNLFCVNGTFVAIEFKIQRDGKVAVTKSFKQQCRQLAKIKDAGGVGLIVAYDENRNKILIREKRIKKPKSYIDWDFEFSSYNNAIDIVMLRIEGI